MEKNEAGLYPVYDTEFEEDPEFDELFFELGRAMEERDKLPAVLNVGEVTRLKQAYDILEYISWEMEGAKVSYSMHRPHKLEGAVSIAARRLEFTEPELFMKVIDLVGNIDLYRMADGTIRIDFSFSNLMIPIREKKGW